MHGSFSDTFKPHFFVNSMIAERIKSLLNQSVGPI